MKNPMKMKTMILSLALGAATMLSAKTYELVPTVSRTSVVLAPGFVGALGTLNVTPGGLEAGNLAVANGVATATFGIPTARIDVSTLGLQIVHTGGLTLRAGSTTVTLSDFIIENFAAGPRLTGLVKVNETIVGRVPLFTLTLTALPEVKSFDSTTGGGSAGTITIQARLTLTRAAAGALNGIFAVNAFTEGIVIGDGTVSGLYIDGAQ
jgi:hypothetical protein